MPGLSPDQMRPASRRANVVLCGCDRVVDSRWLYYWLRSLEGERCIASLAQGAVRERMPKVDPMSRTVFLRI